MYQQGANAYQQIAKIVESPREREAALLTKAAINLAHIRQDWPENRNGLGAALTFNRKLWTILMSSATKEENPLPKPMRENIANLGLFILNQTREALIEPSPGKLDPLININRQLAAGLRAR